MYYEVYLDFYFLESFLTDVALLILVKTVMREKWKAKRIAGTAVLESMWSCIELLLPFRGSFTATFCENGGISDPVDAFVSVYGNRPKQTADLRGQSLAVWEK